jgi:hypothetical protein
MLAAVEGELRAGDAHAHLTAWSVPSVRCKELDGQDAGSWIGVGAFDVGQTQGPLRALLPRARPAAQGGRPADDRLTLSIPPYATTAVRRLPTLPLPLSSMARWKKAAGEPARPEVGDRGCAMPSALTVFMALTGTWHPGWRAQRSRHFKRSSWRPYCKARPSIGWVIHDYDTWPPQRSPAGLRRGGRDRLLRVDRRLLRGRRRGARHDRSIRRHALPSRGGRRDQPVDLRTGTRPAARRCCRWARRGTVAGLGPIGR